LPAVALRREPIDAASQSLENLLRDLPPFVDVGAGQFEREQLLHVLRPVQRAEEDLAVDIIEPQVELELLLLPASEEGRNHLLERLARRVPQLRIRVADGRESGLSQAVVESLFLGPAQELEDARGRLAGAERTDNEPGRMIGPEEPAQRLR
jgi:hypothetical protein